MNPLKTQTNNNMSDTQDTIEHKSSTYEKLPENTEAREGDLAMISGKLFDVVNFMGELRIDLGESQTIIPSVLKEIIQDYYRKRKPEVFEWIDKKTASAHIVHPDTAELINRLFTTKYGSPESLKRQGVKEWLEQFDITEVVSFVQRQADSFTEYSQELDSFITKAKRHLESE